MMNRLLMTERYLAARRRFIRSANDASLFSVEHPEVGPSSETLFLDVAYLGDQSARKVIFVASGTHGIEGYLGSELQSQLLDLSWDLDDTLLVLVHGVNPYGMAWHRRVNESNVDLNRNFMDFDKPLPANPGYEDLSNLVNPTQLDSDYLSRLEHEMSCLVERRGFMAVYQALSGGQYSMPQGVQYGGNKAEWSNLQMRRIWDEFATGKDLIINLDLHTGLGQCSEGLVLLNGDEDETSTQLARKYWPSVHVTPRPKSNDTTFHGLLNSALESRYVDSEVIAITLEYGTQHSNDVTKAMVADNWLHHHGDIDSQQGQQIKQQILDAFYVDTDEFRQATWQRCIDVFEAALKVGV